MIKNTRTARMIVILFILMESLSWAQPAATDPWVRTLSSLIGLTVGDLSQNFPDPRNRQAATPSGSSGRPSATPGSRTGAAGAVSPGGVAGSVGGGVSTGSTEPSAPAMANRIREWISIAEPPENATRGAHLRYTLRGNMVGTVPGAVITSPHETGDFDPVYLWTNKRTLDSVNHCTMEEYVQAGLGNRDIAHCRGRYKDTSAVIPNLVGSSLSSAKTQLAGQGLVPVVRAGSPAPSPDLTGKVESVSPGAGVRMQRGSEVTLIVHSPYVDLRTIPNVVGSAPSAARTALQQAGLAQEVRAGTPAPSPALSGRVEAQEPPPGERVKAGTTVVLTVHSPFVDLRAIPNLIGTTLSAAKAELQQAGLGQEMRVGSPAPSPELSGRIESQQPLPGEKVQSGTPVVLTVHSNYVAIAVVPDVLGLGAAAAKNKLAAAGFTARLQMGPPAPSAAQAGMVASQEPQAGSRSSAGGEVALVIFSNFADTVVVPSVTGMNAQQAEAAVRAAGLSAVLSRAGAAPSRDRAGTVASQSPDAGWKVKPGSSITVALFDAQAPVPPASFAVQSVNYPNRVATDTPAQDLSVSWSGSPSFPVTLTYRPRPGWACPHGDCRSVQRVFQEHTNPLLFAGAVYCYGLRQPEMFLDYEVVLQDANGMQTAPTSAPFYCVRSAPIVDPVPPPPPPPPPPSFGIASVNHATQVQNGGAGENLSVTWNGTPAFPVTMIYRPRPGWGCPQGGCTSPQQVFPQWANPLVFPSALWCRAIGFPTDLYFDYEVVLVDANGLWTEPVSAPFHCVAAAQPSGQELTRETIVATWKISGAHRNGQETTTGMMQMSSDGRLHCNFEVVDRDGQRRTVPAPGSWTLEGNYLVIKYDAGAVYDGQATGNSVAFTMVSSNGWTLNFSRVPGT